MRLSTWALAFGAVASTANGQIAPPGKPMGNDEILHFPIFRRGGAFQASNFTAQMDLLVEQLHLAEARFNTTQREVRGNKVVRAPKDKPVGGGTGLKLMGEIGRNGTWYARLRFGSGRQAVETDIDLLTADFFVRGTTSNKGSRFDDFFSTTYDIPDKLDHPYTNCVRPEDQIAMPGGRESLIFTFAHCKPARQSLDTLLPSGAILGLAPSDSLKQMKVDGFIDQLYNGGYIKNKVFSLTLISSDEGILSIGGTAAEQVSMVEEKIEQFLGAKKEQRPLAAESPVSDSDEKEMENLNRLEAKVAAQNRPNLSKRDSDPLDPYGKKPRAGNQRPDDKPSPPSWRDAWKWIPVEGADGWWQTLMRGVWIDGVKVIKNQPVILDLNIPFILAPPAAVKEFYAGISGSQRLAAPYNNFWSYPCNNPPRLHVEFGGWRYPIMRGMKLFQTGVGPNGKFSLGKTREDTGYCVGAVVETRLGVGDSAPVKKSQRKGGDARGSKATIDSGILAGNGLRDVWILGEQAFRGLGIVFDLESREMGFRTY